MLHDLDKIYNNLIYHFLLESGEEKYSPFINNFKLFIFSDNFNFK